MNDILDAAFYGEMEHIRSLLDDGVNVNSTDLDETVSCPAGPDRPGPRILCSEGSGEIKTIQHQVSSQ